jgi:hypothetical protein
MRCDEDVKQNKPISWQSNGGSRPSHACEKSSSPSNFNLVCFLTRLTIQGSTFFWKGRRLTRVSNTKPLDVDRNNSDENNKQPFLCWCFV